MMTTLEYRKAVRAARRIFVSIFIVEGQGAVQSRISKTKALLLISRFKDAVTIKAEWLTDEKQILMVG